MISRSGIHGQGLTIIHSCCGIQIEAKIGVRTAQMRAQIREAERATEEIEAKIAQSVERHTQEMKALRLSLLQRGIDAESA
jgi:hypothetical protein